MGPLLLACAACGSGEGDLSRGAYVWMSVIISLLPILMLGGILTWVVLTVRANERKQDEEAAAPRSEP